MYRFIDMANDNVWRARNNFQKPTAVCGVEYLTCKVTVRPIARTWLWSLQWFKQTLKVMLAKTCRTAGYANHIIGFPKADKLEAGSLVLFGGIKLQHALQPKSSRYRVYEPPLCPRLNSTRFVSTYFHSFICLAPRLELNVFFKTHHVIWYPLWDLKK